MGVLIYDEQEKNARDNYEGKTAVKTKHIGNKKTKKFHGDDAVKKL